VRFSLTVTLADSGNAIMDREPHGQRGEGWASGETVQSSASQSVSQVVSRTDRPVAWLAGRRPSPVPELFSRHRGRSLALCMAGS